MTLKELKVLAKACDVAYDNLATAVKWGGEKQIKKAQEELDSKLSEYDKAEKEV